MKSPPPMKLSPLGDDDVGEEAIKKNTKVVNNYNEEDESIEVNETINIKEFKNHPLDQVIGNLNQRTLSSENTAQVPPPEDHDSIFIEIPKLKAKKIVQEPNSSEPDSYQPKLPYPERMKVREKDKPSAQQSSSISVKTSENPEEFSDELTLLKKVVHVESFQVYSNPLFEFDDDFTSMDKNHPKSLNSRSDFHHNQNQNESSITFSPRSDPLHHDSPLNFLTLPSRMIREFEIIMSVYDFLLCEISISRSQENVHANPSSIIESLPVSPIPIEDSELVQEEIDIFLVPDDLIPPGVENDDSEDEDNELPNLDHQDNPSSPRPLPEPPNVCYI
ncbi:hypothetical protein Tco_0796075 [Tanacetum coccineum]